MASAEVGALKVKIEPDLSEFAAAISQRIDLDDPLAKAIMANAPTGQDITAHIGDQTFKLHHWTVQRDHGSTSMQTTWTKDN